jgi:predicted permease
MMAARLLRPPRHKPAVLGAVAVTAVSAGLAAMVFALADAYAGRPLPYRDPDRLVSISIDVLSGLPGAWMDVAQADIPSLASWQARTDLFEGLAALEDRGWLKVQLSGRTLPLRGVAVTNNLFEVLGLASRWDAVDPAGARVSPRVAGILAGAESESGRSTLVLPDGVLRVTGTIPRGFVLPEADRTLPVDVLLLRETRGVLTKDGSSTRVPGLIARTRAGVTPEVIAAALSATMPAGRRVSVVPLPTALTARLRRLATGALLASGFIVLVCWTNVFNLALTRGLYRRQEMATRTALGATPARIVGHLLTEALKIAALGSIGALAVTWLALSAALVVLPPQFATLGAPSITARVVAVVVLAGIVAGSSWAGASVLAWKLGARRGERLVAGQDGRSIRVVRFAVIAAQLCAASVLLAGAALLGRSHLNLLTADVGMDEQTATLTVAHDESLPLPQKHEVVQRALGDLRRVGGVQAAAVSGGSLLDQRIGRNVLAIDGHNVLVTGDDGRPVSVDWIPVSDGYFDAMALQFLAGSPPAGPAAAAVISENLARNYFVGRAAMGAMLFNRGRTLPIVGIVRDVRSRGRSVAARPTVYEVGSDRLDAFVLTTYVVRYAGGARIADWEGLVQRVDPLAIVVDSGSVRERLSRSVRDRTFATLVTGLFALTSVLVTTLGLAGVVAYTVVKRTQEIAVRLTLGATGSSVTRLVVREAVAAGACGVTVGAIASVWLSQALQNLLYGVPAGDPTTLSIAAAGLLAIVISAAILPAFRAARIAPANALRIE